MADGRGTFDIHCDKCDRYLFSGSWERPFAKGDEHMLKKKYYCKRHKKEREKKNAKMSVR